MIRRLFILAAVLSLLLCAAAWTLLSRSFSQPERFAITYTRWQPFNHKGPFPHIFFWHDQSKIACNYNGHLYLWRDGETRGRFSMSGEVIQQARREHPPGRHVEHDEIQDGDWEVLDGLPDSRPIAIDQLKSDPWDGTSTNVTVVSIGFFRMLFAILPGILIVLLLRPAVRRIWKRAVIRSNAKRPA